MPQYGGEVTTQCTVYNKMSGSGIARASARCNSEWPLFQYGFIHVPRLRPVIITATAAPCMPEPRTSDSVPSAYMGA